MIKKALFFLLPAWLPFCLQAKDRYIMTLPVSQKYLLDTSCRYTISGDSIILHGNPVISFGNLEFNHHVVIRFRITNLSDTPLVFANVGWGEPFIMPEYPVKPIIRGRSGLLKYTCMTPSYPGYFHKTSSIHTNLWTAYISFKGRVREPALYLNPQTEYRYKVKQAETVITRFSLSNNTDTALTVGELRYPSFCRLHPADSNWNYILPPHSKTEFVASCIADPTKPGAHSYEFSIVLEARIVTYRLELEPD